MNGVRRVDLIHLRYRGARGARRASFLVRARGDGLLANICELLRVTGTAPSGRKPDNILASGTSGPSLRHREKIRDLGCEFHEDQSSSHSTSPSTGTYARSAVERHSIGVDVYSPKRALRIPT